MKMRQKLAAVLAASMVLTAMPVLTLAKSDFSITTGIQVRDEDEKIATDLKIEMKDATTSPIVFFVELDKAEFIENGDKEFPGIGNYRDGDDTPKVMADSAADKDNVTVTYKVKSDKEMTVTVTPKDTVKGSKSTFTLPIKAKLKGGDATISVDGATSVIGDMAPVVFARTSDGKATVKADDPESIYSDTVKVAKITIEEPYKKVILNSDAKKSNDIKFTIKHSDYKFVKGTDDMGTKATTDDIQAYAVVRGEKGFTYTYADVDFKPEDEDTVLTFKADSLKQIANAPGRVTFEFFLKSTEKKPSTGKLNIKVSGDHIDDKTVTVAEVKDFGTVLEMDDKKVVDVTAGQSEEITYTIKEAVANTFVANRDYDVEFTNGYLSPIEDPNQAQKKALMKEIEGKLKQDDAVLAVTDLIQDNDDYVVGYTVTVKERKAKSSDVMEMKAEDVKVYIPLGVSGDVKVKVSGRALGYDAETVAINAKKAVEIKAEPMTVKVGLKGQKGGKVEIKETDKGIFEQGEYVFLKISDAKDEGLKIEKPVIKVTSGDLQIDEDSIDVLADEVVVFKVKRSSDEASTITLTDFGFNANRSLPQGNYNVKIGGRAIADDWTLVKDANAQSVDAIEGEKVFAKKETKGDKVDMNKSIEVKDFVIVGTPNTEDITTANGLRKGTASFVIGSTKYVVNGKEAEMPVAAYTENGRTMIPVRFVANALGINDTEIMYAKGTASVMVGSKTFSFKIGDKVAYINGVPAKTMLTAPVLKNDRCFVPVAELGELLGAEMNWDAATQTATFTVK